MVDILSLLGIAGQAGQIATSFLQAKNFLISSEMRAEQLKNTVLNHEQQLKIFHLQQDYKVRDFEIDNFNKLNQETYKAFIEVHKNRLIECKVPFYVPGSWKSSRFSGHAPAPIIIIATNTYQGDSSFKNDDIIKPLHRVYQTLNEYNSGSLLTITDTRQYFNGDEDARVFFKNELNCPAIIVYSYFTGSTLNIRALYSAITTEQNLLNTRNKNYEFEPKFLELWAMDFTLIHSLKTKKTNPENLEQQTNPFQWKKNLDNLIEAFVGIKLQSLIDEYFQSNYTYTPHALRYLSDRKEKYSKANEWVEFEKQILARHEVFSQRSINLQEGYIEKFLKAEKTIVNIAIIGTYGSGKSSLINSLLQNDIAPVGYSGVDYKDEMYTKPPFEIIEVHIGNGNINKPELSKIIELVDICIFIISREPINTEMDVFNYLCNDFSSKARIVFVNKSDRFEHYPSKYARAEKEVIVKKMSKYVSKVEDIIFGTASVYDAQKDAMIRSNVSALQERIYKEVIVLNRI